MRHLRTRTVLTLMFALPMLAGCACQTTEEPGGPSTQPPLKGTSWHLEALGTTGNLRPALTTTEVTLSFTGDSQVAGDAGCNSYFGQYASQDNGTLTMAGLGSTKMYCNEPGVMQQEQDLLNALAAAERYEVEDGLLHITGGGMELVLSRA